MQILPRSRNENSLWAQKHFWGFKANSSNNFGTSCCSPKDSSAQRTEYLLCSAPPMKCFIHQHRAVPFKDLLTMCLRCILGPNIFWGVWTSEVLDWYPPVHKLACVKVALLEGRSSEHWSRKAYHKWTLVGNLDQILNWIKEKPKQTLVKIIKIHIVLHISCIWYNII